MDILSLFVCVELIKYLQLFCLPPPKDYFIFLMWGLIKRMRGKMRETKADVTDFQIMEYKQN